MKAKLLRLGLVILAVVVVGVVVAILFLDSIVKKGIEAVGPNIAQVDIKLDRVSISLLSGSAGLKGLFVGNPAGFKTPSAIKVGEINLSSTLLGGKSMPVRLADIHLKDLGKGENGITPAELVKKVFTAVLDDATKSAGNAIASLGKGTVDAAGGLGKNAGSQVEKATKTIGDLFKKEVKP